MEYQWIDCYSIGTNRTNGTKGPVECTPTQVEVIGNIISPHNEMHFSSKGRRFVTQPIRGQHFKFQPIREPYLAHVTRFDREVNFW